MSPSWFGFLCFFSVWGSLVGFGCLMDYIRWRADRRNARNDAVTHIPNAAALHTLTVVGHRSVAVPHLVLRETVTVAENYRRVTIRVRTVVLPNESERLN